MYVTGILLYLGVGLAGTSWIFLLCAVITTAQRGGWPCRKKSTTWSPSTGRRTRNTYSALLAGSGGQRQTPRWE